MGPLDDFANSIRLTSNAQRAFLEMLLSKEDLLSLSVPETAAQAARLIGRDLADQPPILVQQLCAMSRHDTSNRLRELASVPTLVVSAAQDRIALPQYGRQLANGIPGAIFEEWPSASHGVTIFQQSKVNHRLREFVSNAEANHR